LYIQNEYSRAKSISYFVLHLIYLIARVFCSFEDIEFVVLGFNFPNSSWRCFKIEDEKNICPSSAHFDDYFSILYIPEIICARKKIHLKRKDSFLLLLFRDQWRNNTITNDRKSIYILWKFNIASSNDRHLHSSTFSSTNSYMILQFNI
jgi:hypothetical protein